MSTNSIYILTGEIHSGKTTAITEWLAEKKDVYGILSPDINGQRFFVDVQAKEQFAMEAVEDESDVLEIGRFRFSGGAFAKAENIIRAGLQQSSGWLVVDEIGPLELKEKGFYNLIKEISGTDNSALKKLFVIRKSLVEEVVNLFQIKDFIIVNSPQEI